MEALHPQHVSNALYGISGLFDESVPSTVIIYRYLKSHFDRVVAVDSNQLSFKDRQMLTSHICLFIDRIQHNGSVISSQLSAELIEMRHRLEPLRMLGCDELPVTPRVHRVLSLFYPSYRVNACFHHCTTHTVYNCPTHITHPS